MELKGVLMQEDGLDLKELEELCVSTGHLDLKSAFGGLFVRPPPQKKLKIKKNNKKTKQTKTQRTTSNNTNRKILT